MLKDPKSIIIQSNSPHYLLRFWDLCVQKLLTRTLMKLTPGVVAVVVVLVALFEVPRRTKVVTFPGIHNTAQTIRA